MALEWLSRLAGTMQSKFGIGGPSSGVNLKAVTGVLQVRNIADSAHANVSLNELQIKDSGSANQWLINSPSLSSSQTLTLPDDAGSNGQSLKRGAGDTTYWGDDGSNSDHTIFDTMTQATSSPATLLASPPDDMSVLEIIVEVTVAAATGNSPVVVVGNTGDDDRYVVSTDVDLHTVGVYKITVLVDESTGPDDVLVTITPDSRSFTFDIYFTYSVPA
jgi:hypothetical protein